MSDFESRSRSVSGRLKASDARWLNIPDYKTFDRSKLIENSRQVYSAIIAEGYDSKQEVEEAFYQTNSFIENAFDIYENRTILERPVDRAFAVPMRMIRGDENYSSEVLPFVPLYDSRFGINSDIRQRSLVGLPPLILDTYSQSSLPNHHGALILAPVFADMKGDLITKQRGLCHQLQRIRLARLVGRNINETAQFARRQLGAKVLGLGAIIPSITNFGNDIKEPGLTTTTGHGGTVHLIVETVKKVINETDIPENTKIGVIGGAGSIGFSTIDVVMHSLDDFNVITFDKNSSKLKSLVDNHLKSQQIIAAESAVEVLKKASIIVTAVTSRIDLNIEDPHLELDLSGKFIIDDSQPGCFDRRQVEARGGKLVWVVGEDGSSDRFLTRDNGYNFGNEAGICGASAIWGCEAEAGVIAASQHYEKALRHRVDPASAIQIGKLCTEYLVRVAPFQSYGRLVTI